MRQDSNQLSHLVGASTLRFLNRNVCGCYLRLSHHGVLGVLGFTGPQMGKTCASERHLMGYSGNLTLTGGRGLGLGGDEIMIFKFK